MSDPERLLDGANEASQRLLRAGLDEPPPAELLERTLEAVAVATAGAGAAAVTAAATTKAGAVVGASTASGSLLGAIGIGALAGLLTVGAYEVAASRSAPPLRRDTPALLSAPMPAASTAAPAPIPAPSARAAREADPPAASARAIDPESGRASTLATELSLLDEARAALRAGDRARARAVLDRYAREIPRGQLGREAAMLRAEVDQAGASAPDAGATIP